MNKNMMSNLNYLSTVVLDLSKMYQTMRLSLISYRFNVKLMADKNIRRVYFANYFKLFVSYFLLRFLLQFN